MRSSHRGRAQSQWRVRDRHARVCPGIRWASRGGAGSIATGHSAESARPVDVTVDPLDRSHPFLRTAVPSRNRTSAPGGSASTVLQQLPRGDGGSPGLPGASGRGTRRSASSATARSSLSAGTVDAARRRRASHGGNPSRGRRIRAVVPVHRFDRQLRGDEIKPADGRSGSRLDS